MQPWVSLHARISVHNRLTHIRRFCDVLSYNTFLTLGTPTISELVNHGYDLHRIQLMQPTETIPLGFKLSKQLDSLQYVVSGVEHSSKAEHAGLQIDDVLVQIEDQDIRSLELSDVSQNIHQQLNSAGSVNILVARKESLAPSTITDGQRMSTMTATYDPTSELNMLLSVGLSNKIEGAHAARSSQADDVAAASTDADKEQIRHIVLEEALTLDFHSFAPDKSSPFKIHAISNVRPISSASRAGLRNGDRILTVNNIDVTNANHKTVRHRLLKKSPVFLTVINDPKYLHLIETVKSNQNRITLSTQASRTEDDEEPPANGLISTDLINVLFIDDHGPVNMKNCVLKKESAHSTLGFALHHVDNLHVINEVETGSPAYQSGLRNGAVVLYVNKQNVERMSPDKLTLLIRSLAQSNNPFHLLLVDKDEVQRLKRYEEKSFLDWKKILSDIYNDHAEQGQLPLTCSHDSHHRSS